MSNPVHFDVEALRAAATASFTASIAESRKLAKKADDHALIDLQVRFYPAALAFYCAIVEARNAGFSGQPLAQAIGVTLGQLMENAFSNLPARLRAEAEAWAGQAQRDFDRPTKGTTRGKTVVIKATPGGHA